ncbi:MAG: MBL fold metallo-hydrolase [Deltaproteobacteria bacterium]|nr:MBL fold metallo-hydrolase [Deltaproteobacteria bacterium]
MLQVEHSGPVERIELARRICGVRVRSASAYLVDGLLIDAGPPAVAPELVAYLRQRPPAQVYNTHHHEDHVGANRLIQQTFGVPIGASAAALRLAGALLPMHWYRRVVWGRPQAATLTANDDAITTPRYRFEVIPTPGHSPDHVCLFERREGWLFAGDLFLHERVRYLRADEDLALEVAALERVAALRPRLLFCAHAGRVDAPVAAINRKLAFWRDRAARARELRRRGIDRRQIQRAVLGVEGPLTLVSGGHFSKAAMLKALLALPDDGLPPPPDAGAGRALSMYSW